MGKSTTSKLSVGGGLRGAIKFAHVNAFPTISIRGANVRLYACACVAIGENTRKPDNAENTRMPPARRLSIPARFSQLATVHRET